MFKSLYLMFPVKLVVESELSSTKLERLCCMVDAAARGFDTAAEDEMATTQEHRERLRKSLTDLLQSQEKLNEHVTHFKQELKRLTA